MNTNNQSDQTIDSVVENLWTEAYNAGAYNARRQPKDQVDFWTNPQPQNRARAALEHLFELEVEQAYKKGYAKGGIDEILRHENAKNKVLTELEIGDR